MPNQKTVLVTGAGGYLGGELVRQLLDLGKYRVFALTSDKGKLYSRFNASEIFSCYDMDKWTSNALSWDQVDIIIHCAFARAYRSHAEIASSLKFTNELFNFTAQNSTASIINISSQGVYGQEFSPLWTEDTPVAPDTIYGLAKFSSELLLKNILERSTNYGTNIRLASLTGGKEGLKPEVISKFVTHAIRGENIRIIGGGQIFSYIDIRDAVSGLLSLIEKDPSKWQTVYNLGSNQRYTIIELANLVAKVAERYCSTPVRIGIEKKDIHQDVGMDSSRFYHDMNWRPKYDMISTIVSLFDHLKCKID